MSKEKREYTVEFKQKAVELTYARDNAAEVCRELGLNPSVPGRWRREAKKCMHLSAIAYNLKKYLKFVQKHVKSGAGKLALPMLLNRMLYQLDSWLVSPQKILDRSSA